MARYRKKPIEIEAWQNVHGACVPKWFLDGAHGGDCEPGATIKIATLEGIMSASPGDYIIRGVKGEVYPCKPGIFDATYDPVVP